MDDILRKYLRRADRTTWEKVPADKQADADDQVMVLNVDSGEYFSLNAVGALIWELADGTRTITEIGKEVSTEYESVDPARVQKDTARLARELVDQQLAELSAKPHPAQET